MSVRTDQSKFVRMVSQLILYADALGYELTFGDAYATSGHSENSFHYVRLAIDLNLFFNGKYLTKTEDHKPLGDFWKILGGTWGGDFEHKDGNHYSWGESREG